MTKKEVHNLLERPAYTAAEAARYVRVPLQTLRYWCLGRAPLPGLVKIPATDPPRLSYLNLLECHMLSSMRSLYSLRLPKVRQALTNLKKLRESLHPLLDEVFKTNRVDLFIEEVGGLVNLSRDGQLEMEPVVRLHLERIERAPTGVFRFFPFVEKKSHDEPRFIVLDPTVGFGKPVISGTGISTSVIAGRFHARESISALAEEYRRSEVEIEEAIRWEQTWPVAA
jgi:uncharacterized protein (DUF433 family)